MYCSNCKFRGDAEGGRDHFCAPDDRADVALALRITRVRLDERGDRWHGLAARRRQAERSSTAFFLRGARAGRIRVSLTACRRFLVLQLQSIAAKELVEVRNRGPLPRYRGHEPCEDEQYHEEPCQVGERCALLLVLLFRCCATRRMPCWWSRKGAGRRPARRRVQAASVGASLSALCGAAYAVPVEPAPDRRPTRRRVQDRVRAAYRSRLRPNPLARGLARCRARLAQLL